MAAAQIIIIAGPTASGKSGLAKLVAKRLNGVIINADSMQVYSDLQVLSARPSTADMEEIPHRLYGVMEGSERCSSGRWLKLAELEINSCLKAGYMPVVVGGTGLYINALVNGIAAIPEVDTEVEKQAHIDFEILGAGGFHDRLVAEDKPSAGKVEKDNKSRLIRAWCVFKSSGKSLFEWQAAAPYQPFAGYDFKTFIVEPERQWLYQRCNERFSHMLENGAIEEVKALIGKGYDPALPLMKALGVPEIAAYIAGESNLEEAAEKARQSTRNYAKRQLTWFRHQLEGKRFDPSVSSMQQMGAAIIAGLS